MPKYEVIISSVIPAYGKTTVEAKDRKEANLIAARIARQGWRDPDLPEYFETERDAMRDFEVYSVLEATAAEEQPTTDQAA